jgi:hypothetical protein
MAIQMFAIPFDPHQEFFKLRIYCLIRAGVTEMV